MTARPAVIGARAIAEALGRPEPTDEQVAVIEAPPGALLVVAGAGSGKTETMTGRVVWIVANGLVAADEVLGLTFTRKAAGELSERITTRLTALRACGLWTPEDDLPAYPSVQTYHAYAGELVREHALRVGREPDARLLTEAACWQYADAVVEAYDGDLADVSYAASTMTEAVVALAAELSEHLLSPDDLAHWIDGFLAEVRRPRAPGRLTKHPAGDIETALRARRALLPLVTAYRDRKLAAEAMDFADVMALAARIALEHPDVGARERRRYRAVLLDEFQDSSDAQLALLAALFGPTGAGLDAELSVTAVGDPNQSIYGWRGASSGTLVRMPSAFGAAGQDAARSLRTSWRNDRRILDVANVLAAPLRANQSEALPGCELVARPGAGDGVVSIARVATLEEEADLIASVLRARWFSTSGGDGSGTDDSSGGERPTAAVLCRRRSQFEVIARILREHGLPVEIVGLGGLLLAPEIVELVALLTVVHDPSRGDQLMRLLTGAVCRLGVADIEVLSAWSHHLGRTDADQAGEVALGDALDQLPPPDWTAPGGLRLSAAGRTRVEHLAAVVGQVRRLGTVALPEVVATAERALGLDVELTARPGVDPGVARAHLDAFAEVVDDFTAAADRPGLGAFLSWLDAARERERGLEAPETEPNTGAVQVMTIHAAKGLEWDVVAVPGLVEGTLPAGCTGTIGDGGEPAYREPSAKGWTQGLAGVPYPLRRDASGLPVFEIAGAEDWPALRDEVAAFGKRVGAHELAEERRLAYVATTRARHEVLLTAAIWGDGSKPRVHSRFLEEIRRAFGPGAGAWSLDVLRWAELPAPETPNPRMSSALTARWPTLDRQSLRAQAATRAADQVRAALAAPEEAATGAWLDLARRLLAERRRAQLPDPAPPVTHLSASGLVDLAGDPAGFAARVRRPMPAPPAPAARRGTAFHAWVEEHFRSAAIVDVDDLPGSADQDDGVDADLAAMKALFLAGEWADRVPLEVESAIETVIGGVSVRARIDAVFPDIDAEAADGTDVVDGTEVADAVLGDGGAPAGVVVVDWKTGLRPGPTEVARRALQLGVYAHAYRELTGARVRAAFYYARTGETEWVELPDSAQIRAVLDQSIAQLDGAAR